MKRLLFLLMIVTFASCKDKSEQLNNRKANNFVGVYYSNHFNNGKQSFHVWVVTKKANDALSIGYFIDDKVQLGNALSSKREVYFLENVAIKNDSTFLIDETDANASIATKLQGTGTLRKMSDGSQRISIPLDFLGVNGLSARPSEILELTKVTNALDDNPVGADFDLIGNYDTQIEENAKNARHQWNVRYVNTTSLELDYQINDYLKSGNIREIQYSYPMKDLKRVNQSVTLEGQTEESNSKDVIKVKAIGTKLVRDINGAPSIAAVVRLVNETQKFTRLEYLELKKQ